MAGKRARRTAIRPWRPASSTWRGCRRARTRSRWRWPGFGSSRPRGRPHHRPPAQLPGQHLRARERDGLSGTLGRNRLRRQPWTCPTPTCSGSGSTTSSRSTGSTGSSRRVRTRPPRSRTSVTERDRCRADLHVTHQQQLHRRGTPLRQRVGQRRQPRGPPEARAPGARHRHAELRRASHSHRPTALGTSSSCCCRCTCTTASSCARRRRASAGPTTGTPPGETGRFRWRSCRARSSATPSRPSSRR